MTTPTPLQPAATKNNHSLDCSARTVSTGKGFQDFFAGATASQYQPKQPPSQSGNKWDSQLASPSPRVPAQTKQVKPPVVAGNNTCQRPSEDKPASVSNDPEQNAPNSETTDHPSKTTSSDPSLFLLLTCARTAQDPLPNPTPTVPGETPQEQQNPGEGQFNGQKEKEESKQAMGTINPNGFEGTDVPQERPCAPAVTDKTNNNPAAKANEANDPPSRQDGIPIQKLFTPVEETLAKATLPAATASIPENPTPKADVKLSSTAVAPSPTEADKSSESGESESPLNIIETEKTAAPLRDKLKISQIGEAVGTSGAQKEERMKLMEKMNEAPPSTGKNFPSEMGVADISSSPRSGSHSSKEDNRKENSGETTPSSLIWNDPSRKETTPARSTPESETPRTHIVDHTQKVLHESVVQMKKLDATSMSVVLKPDANTEISLQLQMKDGQLEAYAQCQRGDASVLNSHWKELQDRLAQQGVHLAPLGTQSQNNGGNGNNPFTRRESPELFQKASAVKTNKSVETNQRQTAPILAGRGWETWA